MPGRACSPFPWNAHSLLAYHQGRARGETHHRLVERVADGHAQQWRIACPAEIAPGDRTSIPHTGVPLDLCPPHRKTSRVATHAERCNLEVQASCAHARGAVN